MRAARDEVMKSLDVKQKAGEISEDDRFTKKESAQKLVDATNTKLEATYTAKESEISR